MFAVAVAAFSVCGQRRCYGADVEEGRLAAIQLAKVRRCLGMNAHDAEWMVSMLRSSAVLRDWCIRETLSESWMLWSLPSMQQHY